MSKTSFFHLTYDKVVKAVESAGFEPTGHCMALNSYENRVYNLMLEDESHIIIKFYRPGRWTKQQIIEEHEFTHELDENEIPVCKSMTFKNGSYVNEIEGIFYSIWPRTGGRSLDEFSDEQLEVLGRYIARIHNIGAAKKTSSRISLTTENYIHKPLQFLKTNNFIPQQYEERFTKTSLEVADIYDTLSQDVPFHRIHGDCHIANLLKGDNGWFFLDFDDFVNGPAVQDVWMLIAANDSEGARQRNVFLNAYRQFREFKNSWLQLIEPLRALRFINYAGWIARRWEDPVFKHIFPHFGTDQYWEKEVIDLETQVEKIFSNDIALASSFGHETENQDEELTNKDFFWDLED